MNENYKWKGVSLFSRGIVVEKIPVVDIPTHSFTKYKIPGRNGSLIVDNKTFDEIPLSLECHFDDNRVVDINALRSWLQGYGTLQLDSEKVYTGYVSSKIPMEQILHFKKFVIQFMLQPIAKSTTVTTVTATANKTFNSNSYTDSLPVITVTTNGAIDIILNNERISLGDSGTFVLDCEAKVITQNGLNASSKMAGVFPRIVPGTNTLIIEGPASRQVSIQIDYYKTYL